MLNTQTRRIGVVGFTLVLAAILAMLLFALAGGSGGTKDGLGFKGLVEWKVFGADGALKASGFNPNATLNLLRTDAKLRLGSGALNLAATDMYDNIQLVDTDLNGVAPTQSASGTAEVTAFQLSSIQTVVADANNDTWAAAFTEGNPQSAGYASIAGDGDTGNFTITATFTRNATAGNVLIEELQLSKGTATSGTPTADVGAWQNVNITLAALDSLVVTWTIDID